MGLEFRNGRPYYYLKKRVGKKVVSEYISCGPMALMHQELAQDAKWNQKFRRDVRLAEREDFKPICEMIDKLQNELNELFTEVAQLNGYHKDHKRVWRKKRV